VHCLVPSRRLPEPGHGGPVRPRTRRVLAVLEAEEVPIVLLLIPDPTMFFGSFRLNTKLIKDQEVGSNACTSETWSEERYL
jgi:hypothetical protein